MSSFNLIASRCGHQATGADIGADGFISEYEVTRAYQPYVISGLKRLGENVIDVTPPEANRTLGDSLMYGINLANDKGADVFVSCHANCADVATAHGCEVVYLSEAGRVLAERICNEIAALGFYNRGAKPDERGLTELHKTDGVAVICEPFFVSSSDDVALYQKIGPEKLGYAIVKGLTGKDVVEVPTAYTVAKIDTPTTNKLTEAIKALQYDMNIDYNAKLAINGLANDDTYAALRGVQDIIAKGHKSNVIKWLQQKLIGYGYLQDGEDTGVYDDATFSAVTNLQSNWERPTDGILKPETWKIFLEN